MALKPYSKDNSSVDPKITEMRKYYFIKNYAATKENLKFIDSFAFNNLGRDYAQYDNYVMIFYKKTATLDENFNPGESNLIEWQGDALALIYTWEKGKPAFYEQYEDGRITHSKVYTHDGKIIIDDTSSLKVTPVEQ